VQRFLKCLTQCKSTKVAQHILEMFLNKTKHFLHT